MVEDEFNIFVDSIYVLEQFREVTNYLCGQLISGCLHFGKGWTKGKGGSKKDSVHQAVSLIHPCDQFGSVDKLRGTKESEGLSSCLQ